jgi:YVTN family beta-propeller protein
VADYPPAAGEGGDPMTRCATLLIVVGLVAVLAVVPARTAAVRAQVIVLSDGRPTVSVIDAASQRVVRTADLPDMPPWTWTWNDDNNYYDGTYLWLGRRNPATQAVEAVLVDLNTLRVAREVPLGTDKATLYIGKASRDGTVWVSKHASGEIAIIDRRTFAVQMLAIPVNGGSACDIDLAAPPDGIERAFVPTDAGNTVLSIDTATRRVLGARPFPGTRPYMLTASSDGRQVWVETRTGNSVAVLDGQTLRPLAEVPAARRPIVGTFSPDGRLHFVGHADDTVVVAYDTQTYREVWRAHVGAYPEKLGVHPAGTFVYAILTKERAVAVIDARTGRVVQDIPVGTNPVGIFVRRLP